MNEKRNILYEIDKQTNRVNNPNKLNKIFVDHQKHENKLAFWFSLLLRSYYQLLQQMLENSYIH